MKTPLAVIVVHQGKEDDSHPYIESLRRAFIGGIGSAPYPAADHELLHPVDFRVFAYPAENPNENSEPKDPERVITKAMEAIIEDAMGTLVVLMVPKPWEPSAGELEEEWRSHARDKTNTNLQVLRFHLALDDAEAQATNRGATDAKDTMPTSFAEFVLEDLDERDLRVPLLTLFCMQFAHLLLLKALPNDGNKRFTFFLSHAKADGVPLATALMEWLKNKLPFFKTFYDTKDLDLGGDLNKQLSEAIESAVVIVLRTEVFDTRYWCQKEVFWAEKHGVPVVVMDGRWNVRTAPSVLSLEASPSVKIPDGNVLRILHAALEEGLRVALLRARARLLADHARLKISPHVIPRRPSLASLMSARAATVKPSHSNAPPFYVIYPNPPLPDELRRDAAEACQAMIPGSNLFSLDEWQVHVTTL